MRVRKGYVIRYERDEAGWWVAKVRGVSGCYTQGRTIEQARSRVLEALAALLDADVSDVKFEDDIRLPAAQQKAVEAARLAAKRAETEQQRASEVERAAARSLVNYGVSLRDAGELLGVSRQRVHQILRANEKKAS